MARHTKSRCILCDSDATAYMYHQELDAYVPFCLRHYAEMPPLETIEQLDKYISRRK